jgi:hypothetical protein
MTFYIFQCSKKGDLYGATDEATGAKLPPQACAGGTWQFIRQLQGSAIGFDAEAASADIKKQGYHLFTSGVTFTEKVVKKP